MSWGACKAPHDVMSILNTPKQYGLVSRGLHWMVVLAIIAQWLLAEAGDDAMPLHQSLGLAIAMIALIRLAWRLVNPSPAWPVDMMPYEIRLARVVHVAFYVLLFAIPISGWVLSSVEDEPLRFFNAFDLPRVVLGNEDTLEEVHETLFNVLLALAALHVLGAAKHWFAVRRAASH
jgi:cytochrome b561